jgi:23S rRNA (cytosine1962-C5)-methyltransferase
MDLPILRLKKNEERRLRAGHVWIYSNEVDIKTSPLKNFSAGMEVSVQAHDKSWLGTGYVNPHSLISVRLTSRRAHDPLTQENLAARFQNALQWREQFYPEPFYRLIFGEADNLPGLIVDRFGEHLVMQINTAGMDIKTEMILTAAKKVLPETQSILLRNDSGSRLPEGLSHFIEAGYGTPPAQIILKENGASFQTSLWEGQKTGWFYDHRLNRSRLQHFVKNKRVLDVFSYLGGWGILAALYGAREVVCLDASEAAVDTIQVNADINQVAEKVKTLSDDAFSGLKNLLRGKEQFDVIVLDPPAFVKKQKDMKEGLLAYQRINELALKLLTPGGVLFSCSCSMAVTSENLLQAIRRASLDAKCDIQFQKPII